jgi:membrane metallo-endopeptidase-like protein 1
LYYLHELVIKFLFICTGEIEDWWEPKTEESFKKKAQCIIDQYGNFTDKQVGLSLNGIQNQGENIADNGGAKEAYKAYRELIT